MNAMRINSKKSLELAREVLENYGGSWAEVRKAGTVRNGVVIVPKRPKQPKQEASLKAPADAVA